MIAGVLKAVLTSSLIAGVTSFTPLTPPRFASRLEASVFIDGEAGTTVNNLTALRRALQANTTPSK